MNLEFRFYMLHSFALGAICALALAASPAFSSPLEVGKVTAEGFDAGLLGTTACRVGASTRPAN